MLVMGALHCLTGVPESSVQNGQYLAGYVWSV